MKNKNLTTHDSLTDIFFPTQTKNIKDFFSDVDFASNITHCIYLPNQNKVAQLCGSGYNLVTNETIMMPIYEKMLSIFGEMGFKTEITSFDDRRFYVRFIVDGQIYNILKGDDVCPVVEIRNSYDGNVKQTVGIGYQRLICKNGLMAFTEDMALSVKHSKILGTINLLPIFEKLDNINSKLERFKALSDRQVTTDEMTKILQAIRSSPTIKYPKKMIDSARLMAQKEEIQLDTPMNAWLLYNGFNYPLNHYETKLLPEEASKIDQRVLRVIERTLSLN